MTNDNKLNGNVAIIDYYMGNLYSVKRACEHVGLNAVITSDSNEINKANGIILPGVGAFGDAMNILIKLKLVHVIKDAIQSGKPFLGICLGFQLLMSESEEFGKNKGFDIFKGRVKKFPNDSKSIKVPQVGWNRVNSPSGINKKWENSLMNKINDGEYMYFVHSFYVIPENPEIIVSMSDYEGLMYCSSIHNKNIFACQFHPERSAEKGLQVYKNFKNAIDYYGKES